MVTFDAAIVWYTAVGVGVSSRELEDQKGRMVDGGHLNILTFYC